MINVTPNTKMVTIDNLKALEAAKDEKAFYKAISENWRLSNATDGLYIENIDYTAEGLSNEVLADFLGIDISAYSDDNEGFEALQSDLSDAYQMRDDEVDARVCWLARDEIINEAREVFNESHLYTKEDDTEHLHYIKPLTREEMEASGVDTSKVARLKLSEAIKSLAVQRIGVYSFDTITEALDAIKLVSKYTEEEAYNAAWLYSDREAVDFMEYTGATSLNLYTTDWGDEARFLVREFLEECETVGDANDFSDKGKSLASFISFLQSDDFARVYSKDELNAGDYEFGADAMLDYAISSFIDWAEEEEQDNSGLQSLKTRLAENSALAFNKDFRTSLAEEVQKLIK